MGGPPAYHPVAKPAAPRPPPRRPWPTPAVLSLAMATSNVVGVASAIVFALSVFLVLAPLHLLWAAIAWPVAIWTFSGPADVVFVAGTLALAWAQLRLAPRGRRRLRLALLAIGHWAVYVTSFALVLASSEEFKPDQDEGIPTGGWVWPAWDRLVPGMDAWAPAMWYASFGVAGIAACMGVLEWQARRRAESGGSDTKR